ncbi:hypothetical protein ABW21_db0207596 [Orbilia brochopaga]|nr:hypothetical protein ABW21_db0207596 [Drechslerella brochopaga]
MMCMHAGLPVACTAAPNWPRPSDGRRAQFSGPAPLPASHRHLAPHAATASQTYCMYVRSMYCTCQCLSCRPPAVDNYNCLVLSLDRGPRASVGGIGDRTGATGPHPLYIT